MLDLMSQFMSIKSNVSKQSEKQLEKEIASLDTASKRYKDKKDTSSPHNRKKCRRKEMISREPSISTSNVQRVFEPIVEKEYRPEVKEKEKSR